LVKSEGKQIRASLRITNFVEAKRKLADFKRDIGRVDTSKGNLSLEGLVQKYPGTLGNQSPKTLRGKTDSASRLLRDFPKGKNCLINKVTPSDLQTWLAGYNFGAPSRQLYIMFLKALFGVAIEDRLLIGSPAEKLAPQRGPSRFATHRRLKSSIKSSRRFGVKNIRTRPRRAPTTSNFRAWQDWDKRKPRALLAGCEFRAKPPADFPAEDPERFFDSDFSPAPTSAGEEAALVNRKKRRASTKTGRKSLQPESGD
jgi:hypothetical protein